MLFFLGDLKHPEHRKMIDVGVNVFLSGIYTLAAAGKYTTVIRILSEESISYRPFSFSSYFFLSRRFRYLWRKIVYDVEEVSN